MHIYFKLLFLILSIVSSFCVEEDSLQLALDEYKRRAEYNLPALPPAIVNCNVATTESFTCLPFVLWDPLLQFPDIFDSYRCPVCSLEGKYVRMRPTTIWNDGSTAKRKPRIIYDVSFPVQVVGRIYRCQLNSDHTITSTHHHVCSTLALKLCIKLHFTHKYGYSDSLVNMVTSSIISGLSFVQIEKIILGNYKQFNASKDIPYPKQDFLEKMFMDNFSKMKETITKRMSSSTANWISADHTFKSVANIGYTRKSDGKWIKQYNSLFCILNDRGQILKWQFTQSTKFEEVWPCFYELAERFKNQQKKISVVYVDNCCQARKQLREFFKNDTLVVKLDLFHAIKRFMDTIPKRGNRLRKVLAKDYKNIFRINGDYGKQRILSTPTTEVLNKNLNRFVKKWKGFKYEGKPVLNKKSLKAIENIKEHISKGCLSNIPKGGGTNRNERLHRTLKKVAGKSRMGVPLAEAIFSQVVMNYNRERQDTDEQIINGNDLSTTERFGLMHSESFDNKTYNLTEYSSEEIKRITERTSILQTHMLNFKKIGLDKIANLTYFLLNSNVTAMSKIPKSEEKDLLIDRADSIGHEILQVDGDGNCFFTSLGFQVQNLLQMENCPDAVLNHFENLGISPSLEAEELTSILRNLIVNEWITHPQRYNIYNTSADSFVLEATSFQRSGHYSSSLGDAMPLGAANALAIPVVLITAFINLPTVFITPETLQLTQVPLILGLQGEHYSILIPRVPITKTDQEPNEQFFTPIPRMSCRCGVNSVSSETKNCCTTKLKKKCQKRKYESRCPCRKNKQTCSNLCKCKNCGNEKPTNEPPMKRKRNSKKNLLRGQPKRSEMVTSEEYTKSQGERIKLGPFSEIEWLLLESILFFLSSKQLSDKSFILKVTKLFNGAARFISKEIPNRTEAVIKRCLKQREDKKKLPK